MGEVVVGCVEVAGVLRELLRPVPFAGEGALDVLLLVVVGNWVSEGASDVGVKPDDAVFFSSSFIELLLIPQSIALQPPTMKV